MAVSVPPRWRVLRDPYTSPGAEPHSLCLVPPGSYLRDCAGVYFAWDYLAGFNGVGNYRPNEPGGWYDGTETAMCPVVGSSKENFIKLKRDPVTGGGLGDPVTDSGRRAVGTRSAAWTRWHSKCDDGSTFDPEVWYLPEFGVLARDLTGHATTDRILASVAFGEDGAEIPAGATHQNAWVSAVDGDTFTITPFRYTNAGSIKRPKTPPRKVDVSQAVCTGNVPVPGELLTPVVACKRFACALQNKARVRSLLWFEPNGTVAQVSMEFRPNHDTSAPEEVLSTLCAGR